MKDKHNKTHAKAMNLVLQCGIPPDLVGCKYLTEAIELKALNNHKAMSIYRTIAQRNAIKPKSVIRDISYALSKSETLHRLLSKLLGDVPIDKKQLHNSLVITYLSIKLDSEISKDEDKDNET